MSDASGSPEELHDEEQVDIDGGVDLDEEVDDASADQEEEEEDEEEKAQGLDLDVELEGNEEEHSGSQEDREDVDILNGDHEQQTMDSDSIPAEGDAHVDVDDIKEEDKEEKDGEKSGELLKRPPHGSEVFVGGITRDTTEEDLRSLCSSCGDIYEVACAFPILLSCMNMWFKYLGSSFIFQDCLGL